MAMCLTLLDPLSELTMSIVLWLSQNTVDWGLPGSVPFGWGIISIASWTRFRAQSTSCTQSASAMVSLAQTLVAVDFCFDDRHNSGQLLNKIAYPVVDLRVSLQPPQSLSAYAPSLKNLWMSAFVLLHPVMSSANLGELPLLKLRASDFVPFR